MKHGFIKVASGTPEIKVADVDYNLEQIKSIVCKANDESVKLLVLPELCVTGYTCGDLFFQQILLEKAQEAIVSLANFTVNFDMLVVVGAPIQINNDLYNCAIVYYKGKILGVVPKTYIPNHNEFCEKRYFCEAPALQNIININGTDVNFSTKLIFRNSKMPEFSFAIEISEDLLAPVSPSAYHALCGANIIANLSASNALIGKYEYNQQLIANTSARLICGYVYANAGDGESTTDLVFAGHNIIAENGIILNESDDFSSGIITSEIDVFRLETERHKNTTFQNLELNGYQVIEFDMTKNETTLTRKISTSPFVPEIDEEKRKTFDKILKLQSHGLKKRLIHTNSNKVVIGISGGLDSTLALIVAIKAMELINRPATDVIAVTMPCFGTSDRTKNNARKLCELLSVTLREIDITNSVLAHFSDINHEPDVYDVAYENSQARERTQVLMDIANMENGLVIGTGDLSENALGWSTYNGDQMSMYAVNISVPKSLIRYIIDFYANEINNDELKRVLADILDTPVSPELLPGNEIKQRTEDIVGPYELHDFFLYYIVRWGFEPSKVLRLAKYSFDGIYDSETILKWLKIFYRRFFKNQFKRSCMPDGVKIGSVALSPRGDLRMPSDAVSKLWLDNLE